jgi:pilus assembly protein FimV
MNSVRKRTEMTIHNKLKIAILTILSSQTISALTLEPIQVQSDSGSLLYAEIKFKNADPNAKIEAGLAESKDLISSGLSQQSPGHLNFYTRRSGDGTGVIVITSSRPMIEPELNILLRIREGEATHVHQIKTPLTRQRNIENEIQAQSNEVALVPQMIVSEKDIELNLPSSAQFQSSPAITTPEESTPALNVVPPKVTTSSTEYTTTTVSVRPSNQSPTAISVVAPSEKPASPATETATDKNETKNSGQDKTSNTKGKLKDQPKTHIVQANESLWKIASRIAAETNQSVPEVMQRLKENNQNAFVNGNINRIRQGTALNLAAGYNPNAKHKTVKNGGKFPQSAQKQSGKAKYRINQAEMSIVAENTIDSTQGSATEKAVQNQTTPELSSKVMTAREKTVKLQKNVSQSTLALQHKDQRIQLLNARLAQLQQQLQQQNHAEKPVN